MTSFSITDDNKIKRVPMRGHYDHAMVYEILDADFICHVGFAVVVPGEKKADALRHISEHILPGRWQEVRPPSASELKATTVLEVNNEHASAKMRSGPPDGNVRDLDLPVWAGVIPLKLLADTPIPDPGLRSNHDVPPSVLASIKNITPNPFKDE